ncbi:hypothetical protein ACFL1N_05160 [Thermodesulfobacteriota bacterium]
MKNPYQNIIDFIDTAVDSDELMSWLINLEKLPENLRGQHLIEMKSQMIENNEPAMIIEILESINKSQVLSAINAVIKDVYASGMKTRKYLKSENSSSFNILVSLMAAT